MPRADRVPGRDCPRWRLRALATVTALIGVGVLSRRLRRWRPRGRPSGGRTDRKRRDTRSGRLMKMTSQHRDRLVMPGCRRASPTPRMRVVHGGKRRRRARPASAALAFASNLARRGARATGRHRSHWVLGEGGGRTWTRGRRLSAAASDCQAAIICCLAVSRRYFRTTDRSNHRPRTRTPAVAHHGLQREAI